jgi:hypothetical protein
LEPWTSTGSQSPPRSRKSRIELSLELLEEKTIETNQAAITALNILTFKQIPAGRATIAAHSSSPAGVASC